MRSLLPGGGRPWPHDQRHALVPISLLDQGGRRRDARATAAQALPRCSPSGKAATSRSCGWRARPRPFRSFRPGQSGRPRP
jgi:hypothetical protein